MGKYWLTPPEIYEKLNEEFHFDFDPCPYPHDPFINSLDDPWGKMNYCNPPFRKAELRSMGRVRFLEVETGEPQKSPSPIILANLKGKLTTM